MSLTTMYAPVVNSPELTTTGEINTTATEVTVSDASAYSGVPLPVPMTIGDSKGAETVLVTAISGNTLTVTRGFEGTARSWPTGSVLSRNFTAYDQTAMQANITALEQAKAVRPADAAAGHLAMLTADGDYADSGKAAADFDAAGAAAAVDEALGGRLTTLSDTVAAQGDVATAHTADTAAHTTAEQKAGWDAKADEIPVIANTDAAVSLTMADDAIYNCGTLTSLTLAGTAPADAAAHVYGVNFSSGTTKTTLTVPAGWKCAGDDCDAGVFVPAASKGYEMIGAWYGEVMRWAVRAW